MLMNNEIKLIGYMKGEPIMSDGWTCDKCNQHFLLDSTEERHRVAMWPYGTRNKEGSQINLDLCETCKERLDKWLKDKSYIGVDYSFNVFDETPVYVDDLVYRPAGYKTPRVYIGTVKPFPEANLDDKSYPAKMLEEAAEVYSAWEDWREADAKDDPAERSKCRTRMYREICDVIQTCANMAYAVAKDNPLDGGLTAVYLTKLLEEVERKNREKGRYDI